MMDTTILPQTQALLQGSRPGDLDESTECLTKRGWLRYHDLCLDDFVLSVNMRAGLVYWTKLNGVHLSFFDGQMNTIKTNHIDMAVTDEHCVIYSLRRGQGRNRKQWLPLCKVDAQSLTSGRVGVLVSGNVQPDEYPMSDNDIRLAAWVLTDGYMEKEESPGYRVMIYQRESNADTIRVLLNDSSYDYVEHRRLRGAPVITGTQVQTREAEIEFRLCNGSNRTFRNCVIDRKDRFPAWAWELSDRQFDVFLDSLIDGDGTIPKHVREGTCAFYNRKPLVDELQAICVMHGYSASVYEYEDRAGAMQYRLNICKRKIAQVDIASKWSKQRYSGHVWSVSLDGDGFAVRRNGKERFAGVPSI